MPAHPPDALRTLLPLGMVTLLAAILIGAGNPGMSWQGPSTAYEAAMLSPFLLAALYLDRRASPALSECCVVLFLYFLFPILGVKISYLATTLAYPLADDTLARVDAAIGFDWAAWSAFLDRHDWLQTAASTAYFSPVAQAVASALVFAVWRPGQRNYEVLFILLLALLIVLVAYAAYPALGPQSRLGIHTLLEQTILAIRAGRIADLPYLGIVSFPSYHTIMAIVFTYGHRDLKYSFPPFLALNAVMLLAVPKLGGHYAADMIGGAAIACVAIAAARRIYRPAMQPAFCRTSLGQSFPAHRQKLLPSLRP